MGDCDRSVRRVSVDNSPTGPEDVLFRPSMLPLRLVAAAEDCRGPKASHGARPSKPQSER
jgi:hypothetical protein